MAKAAPTSPPTAPIYFSQYFDVDPEALEAYGALDICLVSDLPLFIDPFLLFNSGKSEYQELHETIVGYIVFLRDKIERDGPLDKDLEQNLCRFKEVKENWLGYTEVGNRGSGLGAKFARSMGAALVGALKDFGREEVPESPHLEKLALIRGGVGRDNISDFTTNLIHEYLLEYTQAFAREYVDPSQRAAVAVRRVRVNYETESWADGAFELPVLDSGEHVLLTPVDLLTRDETWINHSDMTSMATIRKIGAALPDGQLRAQLDNYLRARLSRRLTAKQEREVRAQLFRQLPELIDHYLKLKEDDGDRAEAVSERKREEVRAKFVVGVQDLIGLLDERGGFYDGGDPAGSAYDECLRRALEFKRYVEDQDGYLVINRKGQPFANEREVQIYLGLAFRASSYDVNREVNNGRGPVDFKISKGRRDAALLEVKLGSNTQLKRNLEHQVGTYQKANAASGRKPKAVKLIVCFSARETTKVEKILKDLKLTGDKSIVVVDARRDNKPSASKASSS